MWMIKVTKKEENKMDDAKEKRIGGESNKWWVKRNKEQKI